MGSSTSKQSSPPPTPRISGLQNFGNTCYCNSVLQALFACEPFRQQVIEHHKQHAKENSSSKQQKNMLYALGELFDHMNNLKKGGVVTPRSFIHTLREENTLFRTPIHHDAHEFLNYLLNEISEILNTEAAGANEKNSSGKKDGAAAQPNTNFVTALFGGVLTNETTCFCCENITSRDEPFLDLSVDVKPDCSVPACLRVFSECERLCAKDKFYCDQCCSLQEAEKRMQIRSLPPVLCVHLKRFKYVEDCQRHVKLNYRVVFAPQLRVPNTVFDSPDSDKLYNLFAVVVHVGSSSNHGHYIALARTAAGWVEFDDDITGEISEADVSEYFGFPGAGTRESAHEPGGRHTGYLLFYHEALKESDPIIHPPLH
eukprot:GCRY01004400.1.p1 GENE.GCRY01004400.1~~GCRY01004400.1.p1  ORF type:complete len:371 (-),score=96.15 GCRY01004400.1:35-1147(-)